MRRHRCNQAANTALTKDVYSYGSCEPVEASGVEAVDTASAARGRRVRGRPRTCVVVSERGERDERKKREGIRVEAGRGGEECTSALKRRELRVECQEPRVARRGESRVGPGFER